MLNIPDGVGYGATKSPELRVGKTPCAPKLQKWLAHLHHQKETSSKGIDSGWIGQG